MKKITILVLLTSMIAGRVHADSLFVNTSLFNEYRVKSEKYLPAANLWLSKEISEKVDIFAFSGTTKGYSVAYGGAFYKPVSTVSVGVGVGFSTILEKPVIAPHLMISHGKFFLLSLVELEGKNYFMVNNLTVKIHEKVKTGIFQRRFSGVGPQLIVSQGPISVRVAPLYDWEAKSFTGFASIDYQIVGK